MLRAIYKEGKECSQRTISVTIVGWVADFGGSGACAVFVRDGSQDFEQDSIRYFKLIKPLNAK